VFVSYMTLLLSWDLFCTDTNLYFG